jgi:hypothetical protein
MSDKIVSSDTDLASEVERFMEASGFRHQLVLEGFTAYFKGTLERHGLYPVTIQRARSLPENLCTLPPSYTPSKKFKLYQKMHALIRESGYQARRLWLLVNKRRVSMWIVPQSN